MNVLTLIVHTNAQEQLTEQLRSMEQITGFTFSHVEGHGTESESDNYLSAHDATIGLAPRLRIDILIEDPFIGHVLTKLRSSEGNIAGQGIYWVSPVKQGGHLL